MSDNNKTPRGYMALAPILSLAGIFISPYASTLPPLILYFLFSSRRPMVAKVALQTADLAFSIILWIWLISLSLGMANTLNWLTGNEVKQIWSMATSTIILIFVISLFYAIYKAYKGHGCTHFFSFKIAERVLNVVNNKNKESSDSNK